MNGRVAIDIDVQTYLRILLEAQRRRKAPDDVVDELVNEALDRILAEVRSLGAHHSLTPIEPPPPREDCDDDLARFKRSHILRVLIACGGNITTAADRLGVARKTLQRKMKSLYVDPLPATPPPRNPDAAPRPLRPEPAPEPALAPVAVELCAHDNVAGACRQGGCVDVAVTPALPSRRPMCDVRQGQRCEQPLYWRGSARCGCPRPSRSAA